MIKRIYTSRYNVLYKQVSKARRKFYHAEHEGTAEEADAAYAAWMRLQRKLKEAVIFEDFCDPCDGEDLSASMIRNAEQSKIQFSLWKHEETGSCYLQVHGWSPETKKSPENGQRGDEECPQTCYVKIQEEDIPAGCCARSLAEWPERVSSLGPRLFQIVLTALQASIQRQDQET